MEETGNSNTYRRTGILDMSEAIHEFSCVFVVDLQRRDFYALLNLKLYDSLGPVPKTWDTKPLNFISRCGPGRLLPGDAEVDETGLVDIMLV